MGCERVGGTCTKGSWATVVVPALTISSHPIPGLFPVSALTFGWPQLLLPTLVPGILYLSWHSFPGQMDSGPMAWVCSSVALGFPIGSITCPGRLRPLSLHRGRPSLPLHGLTQGSGPPEPQHVSLGHGYRIPRLFRPKPLEESSPGWHPERPEPTTPLCRFSGSQHCGHIHCAYQYREHYHCLDPECNYQVMSLGHPPCSRPCLLAQQQRSLSGVAFHSAQAT